MWDFCGLVLFGLEWFEDVEEVICKVYELVVENNFIWMKVYLFISCVCLELLCKNFLVVVELFSSVEKVVSLFDNGEFFL